MGGIDHNHRAEKRQGRHEMVGDKKWCFVTWIIDSD